MSLLTIVMLVTVIAICAAVFYWQRTQRNVEQEKVQAAWLNRELARADSQIEVAEIWSEEHNEKNNSKVANAILEKVGTALSADTSVEAKRLRDFLAQIHTNIADSGQNTPQDVALAWFSCLQMQDKEPESELAQCFKVLNDAWATTRDGQAQISDLRQLKMRRASDSTLAKKVTQS
jgi:predicted negative regulator of RcsB-dependent stress response